MAYERIQHDPEAQPGTAGQKENNKTENHNDPGTSSGKGVDDSNSPIGGIGGINTICVVREGSPFAVRKAN